MGQSSGWFFCLVARMYQDTASQRPRISMNLWSQWKLGVLVVSTGACVVLSYVCDNGGLVVLKIRTLVTRLVMVDKVIVIARFSSCWSTSHDPIRFQMDVTIKWPWRNKIRNLLSRILYVEEESTRFIHGFSFVHDQPFVVSWLESSFKQALRNMFLLLAHTCFIFETMPDIVLFSTRHRWKLLSPTPASALVVHG